MAQARHSPHGSTETGGARCPFPFTPYLSQERLMAAIHSAIEDKACLIAESPTGTARETRVRALAAPL